MLYPIKGINNLIHVCGLFRITGPPMEGQCPFSAPQIKPLVCPHVTATRRAGLEIEAASILLSSLPSKTEGYSSLRRPNPPKLFIYLMARAASSAAPPPPSRPESPVEEVDEVRIVLCDFFIPILQPVPEIYIPQTPFFDSVDELQQHVRIYAHFQRGF